MNTKKAIVLLIAGALLIGVGFGIKEYNREVESTADLAVDIQISASDLFNQYQADETSANNNYLDKTIEVTGTVRELVTGDSGELQLVLESDDMLFGIICQFEGDASAQLNNLSAGNQVVVKGICTGLLMDVVLKNCVIQ